MRVLVLLSSFCIFIGVTRGAVYQANATHPDYNDKCLWNGATFSVYETVVLPECTQGICYENGIFVIASCTYQEVEDGFKLGNYKYPEAKYPDCCEREIIKCKSRKRS